MNATATLLLLLMLAVLVEYLVNLLKPLLPATNYPVPLLVSMLCGVGLALLTNLNALEAFGFTVSIPVVGQVVTGLIVSGGSTGVHELIAKLRDSREH